MKFKAYYEFNKDLNVGEVHLQYEDIFKSKHMTISGKVKDPDAQSIVHCLNTFFSVIEAERNETPE